MLFDNFSQWFSILIGAIKMTTNPALFKLLDSNPESFDYKGYITTWIISDGLLTKEEIESLRKENEADLALGGEPFIANFLPDGERPAHVKKR